MYPPQPVITGEPHLKDSHAVSSPLASIFGQSMSTGARGERSERPNLNVYLARLTLRARP